MKTRGFRTVWVSVENVSENKWKGHYFYLVLRTAGNKTFRFLIHKRLFIPVLLSLREFAFSVLLDSARYAGAVGNESYRNSLGHSFYAQLPKGNRDLDLSVK